MGPVDFTEEEVVGIILDKWHPNANNGLVKGKQYFNAPPGRGYFAKRALIIENLGCVHGGDVSGNGGALSNAPMPKINFKIRDRVKLARGKTGIVKVSFFSLSAQFSNHRKLRSILLSSSARRSLPKAR